MEVKSARKAQGLHEVGTNARTAFVDYILSEFAKVVTWAGPASLVNPQDGK